MRGGKPGTLILLMAVLCALPAFSHPHDVAPAADGGVWYTPQLAGGLGWLDPATGKTRRVSFGIASSPHGVIVGPRRPTRARFALDGVDTTLAWLGASLKSTQG